MQEILHYDTNSWMNLDYYHQKVLFDLELVTLKISTKEGFLVKHDLLLRKLVAYQHKQSYE
ncbi:MAG: hypothetical protein E6Q36_03180 [Chryseobacterium sp.]|nr:MAG: hypothetical protein E6Q36_03180 [Chryseobacterium sp.]